MGRTWVPVVGAIAGLVFVLTQLTGSDVDEQVARTLYTALYLLLATILASVGIALTRLQPRYTLLGVATTMLSLLAFGAFVVSIWSSGAFWFGFGFIGETSAKVAWITLMLAVSTSAASALILITERAGGSTDVRLARFTGLGALAFLIGLAILGITEAVEVGERLLAIVATVYVVGGAVALILRLLPARNEDAR